MGSIAAVTFALVAALVVAAALVSAAAVAAETTGVVPAVRPVAAAAASTCVKEKPEG